MIATRQDPSFDYWDYCDRHDKWLKKRPCCDICGEHIQDDFAFHWDGYWICDDCISDMREEVTEVEYDEW